MTHFEQVDVVVSSGRSAVSTTIEEVPAECAMVRDGTRTPFGLRPSLVPN